jgi:hypothetical protein
LSRFCKLIACSYQIDTGLLEDRLQKRVAIGELPVEFLWSIHGGADRPAEPFRDWTNGLGHIAERNGAHYHQVNIARCCWRPARERSVDERVLDAIRERQKRRLQLGCYPGSLVDQPLQLREAGMTRVRLVVDQIRVVALPNHAGVQQGQQFAA